MSIRDGARILIIDDEPALRELLHDALDNGQMLLSLAGSGKEAIELAQAHRPDIVITDLCLGDCSGLDVIDYLRDNVGDVPAVVITGRGDTTSLSEASRRRPLELMTKPLNLDRLRSTISRELDRQAADEDRKGSLETRLRDTCSDLIGAYRALSSRTLDDRVLLQYQYELLSAKGDDDVFRSFFRTFVRRGGAIFGAAMVCDSNADLRITGRFGVPRPDGLEFCQMLSAPPTDVLLGDPHVQVIDAGDEAELFDEEIRDYLPGLSIMAIPLIPVAGEMIGMVMLYRKGEQPFSEDDVALAEMLSHPTATAVRRND